MPAFIPVGERPFLSVEHLDQIKDGSLETSARLPSTPAASAFKEVTVPLVSETATPAASEPAPSLKSNGAPKSSADPTESKDWSAQVDALTNSLT